MKARVNRYKFVRSYMKIYNAGGGYLELSQLLHASPSYCRMRTAQLRHKGVKLPSLSRSAFIHSINDLNQYISDHSK